MTNSRATTEDIIRDLRTWDRDEDVPRGPNGLLGDAADEIERLTQERHQLQNELTAAGLENERLRSSFKNFHRLLCERFEYGHDEVDWERDQLSLIEWIAKSASHEPDGVLTITRDVTTVSPNFRVTATVSEPSATMPCVWRSGCQDVPRCTEAGKCLQISRKGSAEKRSSDHIRDLACCDNFVRESVSEFCAVCGYTNLDHLRRHAEKSGGSNG